MRIHDLHVVVRIAELGSIKLSASDVGLTQPAVSRILQRLEADSGISIFDRSTKPLRLTRDGTKWIEMAREVILAARAMSETFDAEKPPTGELRLGLANAIAPQILSSQIGAQLEDFPLVKLKFRSGWSKSLAEQLENGGLDAALLLLAGTDIPPDSANPTLLASSTVSALSARRKLPKSLSLAEANETGWALNPKGCGYRKQLEEELARLSLKPNVVAEINSLETQLSIAARGDAITLAPVQFLGSLSGQHETHELPITGLSLTTSLYLATSRASARFHVPAEFFSALALAALKR